MPEFLRNIRASLAERRVLWLVGGLVGLVLIAALVAYWFVVPRVADDMVRERLAAVERRADLEASYERVEASAFEGVEIHEFRVALSDSEDPLVAVDHVRARLDLYHLAFGDPVVSSLEVRGARLAIRRRSDGSTNLERLRERLADGGSGGDTASGDGGGPPSFLRYFGGVWPDAHVEDAEMSFEAADEARPWPVRRLATGTFELDSSGSTARVRTSVDLERGSGGDDRWQFPEGFEVDGTLRLPLGDSTGTVSFDRPAEVVGLGPAPFVRAGFSRVDVGDGQTVELHDLTLAVQGDGEPARFGTVDRVRVSLARWPTGPQELELEELVVERPTVTAEIDRQHGSAVGDLVHLLRGPVARQVADRARLVARLGYLEIPRWRRPEIDDSDDPSDVDSPDKPGRLDRIRTAIEQRLQSRLLPNRIRIEGAEVRASDARRMGLQNPSREFGLQKGRLSADLQPDSGTVDVKGGFDVTGNESASEGAVSFEFGGNFREGTIEGETTVNALDLSWVSQMLGASVARRLLGGTLHATFETSPGDEGNRREFSGYVSVQDASMHVEAIAEDPIRDLDAGYEFEGYYAPDEPLPEPEYVEWRHLSWDDRDSESDDGDTPAAAGTERAPDGAPVPEGKSLDGPPEDAIYPKSGALVFTDGTASMNGVSADFEPALYGLDGLQRRPTRFDLRVGLERTPVQHLFESVPEAIRGPVADSEMRGTFAWNFDAEVPLYDAGEMEWDAQPDLRGFELVSLPEPVDVRELEDNFLHVVEDSEMDYERQLQIPEYRPVSERYIASITEDVTESGSGSTSDGEAPSEARPGDDGESGASDAESDAAAAESADAASERETVGTFIGSDPPEQTDEGDEGPTRDAPAPRAGRAAEEASEGDEPPYTYVRLDDISKWLPRAIMTTEDNSFFEHDGFNWFALENSVEENIEAGGFVRGASTVSMQLIKNLYLSFDKVLARKLREAYLVWLMERVVDVPKPRILELYFNIIEFGPRIYGIHEASVHYFGKRPGDLSLTESVFLVSIVPNPKEYHRFYEDGEITDSWFESLMTYIEIMEDRDRATPEDVERAREDRPTFYKPAPGEPRLRPSSERDEGADDGSQTIDDFFDDF